MEMGLVMVMVVVVVLVMMIRHMDEIHPRMRTPQRIRFPIRFPVSGGAPRPVAPIDRVTDRFPAVAFGHDRIRIGVIPSPRGEGGMGVLVVVLVPVAVVLTNDADVSVASAMAPLLPGVVAVVAVVLEEATEPAIALREGVAIEVATVTGPLVGLATARVATATDQWDG